MDDSSEKSRGRLADAYYWTAFVEASDDQQPGIEVHLESSDQTPREQSPDSIPPIGTQGGDGRASCAGAARPKSGSVAMRIWMAVPDWTFRVMGAGLFLVLLGFRISVYFEEGFWKAGYYYGLSGGRVVYMPYARVLVDLTYLLIALAFVFRCTPRARASHPREIVIPIISAFWPFLPVAMHSVLKLLDGAAAGQLDKLMLDGTMSYNRFLVGIALMAAGNALDVWGYAVLFRSVSIVAEARELKVTGPYRIVRHPVYLGQILAQAGVWLYFAKPTATWWIIWTTFYLLFVAGQLYRGRVEDRVLEQAFGERYLEYKKRTFWFV